MFNKRTNGENPIAFEPVSRRAVRELTESVEIAKDVVDPEDIEGLQDLIIAASNQALEQIEKTNQERIGAITGGMKMPF